MTGDNPTTIAVGATYIDAGATITAPAGDINLPITASVDGGASTSLGGVMIMTGATSTHTIVYSATNSNGLVGTASRVVNVQ